MTIQPPTQQHSIYVYQHDVFRVRRAVDFVLAGLRLGETVMVVAPDDLRTAVRAGLSQQVGISHLTYREVDAADYVGECFRDGILNREAFWDTVAPFLKDAQEAGRPMRLYGEGAALLWKQGHRQAALDLEGLWNEVIPRYPFSTVLCGYPSEKQTAEELLELLGRHNHVCVGDRVQHFNASKEGRIPDASHRSS
ncbi:MAG: MEDS domain-containing protein [Nitrospiraceae bacterium]|nr:MEDS domain-containing protein [Nitrospiraceae bacterium]